MPSSCPACLCQRRVHMRAAPAPCLPPIRARGRPGCLRPLPALSAVMMVFLSSSFSRRSTSRGWDSPSARTASGPREAGLRAPAARGRAAAAVGASGQRRRTWSPGPPGPMRAAIVPLAARGGDPDPQRRPRASPEEARALPSRWR